MSKIKKNISVAVLVLSIISIIIGVVFIAGCNGSHTGANGGVGRASTSIEFGADFYTTSAQYTGLAANAATDIYTITRLGFGIVFLLAGLGGGCFGTYHFLSIKSTGAIEKDDTKSSDLLDNEESEPAVL